MAKLTAYDINSSTQVARTHSGVSDSQNNGKSDTVRAMALQWPGPYSITLSFLQLFVRFFH